MAESRRHIEIARSATSQAHLYGGGRRNTLRFVNRRDTLAVHSYLFSRSFQSVRGIDVFEALSAHQTQPPYRRRWYRTPSSVTTTEVVGLGVMLSLVLMVVVLLFVLLLPNKSVKVSKPLDMTTNSVPKASKLVFLQWLSSEIFYQYGKLYYYVSTRPICL